MKILVTGSSGFIGSFLVDELSKEFDVIGFDKIESKYNSVKTIIGDITNQSDVKIAMNGVNFVFHFAGMLGTHELIDDTYNAVNTNILGTVNILDIAKISKAKVLLASKPNVWLNTYSITKQAAEQILLMYRENYKIEASIVKIFNVYGPRQLLFEDIGYQKFIPHSIVNALKNENIQIYGNGQQTVDLIHVLDSVNACISIMKNWNNTEGKIYEVGKDELVLNDVANQIIELINSNSSIEHIAMRKGETPDTKLKANTQSLEDDTGFKPKIELKNGLLDCIEWYKQNYLARK